MGEDGRQWGKPRYPAVCCFHGPKESEQTMRLALILKTDAQGSIAAVKHMFSEVILGC